MSSSGDGCPEWRENMVGWGYLSLPGGLQVWVTRLPKDPEAKWTWSIEDRERRTLLSSPERFDTDIDARLAALLRLHEVYGERQSLIARLIGELRGILPSRGKYPSFRG